MFDAAVVINLQRRPELFQRFMAGVRRVDWPFPEPIRLDAVDGTLHPPPDWFRCSAGSWGNLKSFLQIFTAAIRDGIESVVIFEDDAVFPHDDFGDRVREFVAAVPDDWDQIYLGGGHHCRGVLAKDVQKLIAAEQINPVPQPLPIKPGTNPVVYFGLPVPVNDLVLRANCVFGAWATVWRRPAFSAMADTIRRFPNCLAEPFFYPDRLVGTLQWHGKLKAYAPWRWLVHHGSGQSDSSDAMYKEDYSFDLHEAIHDALWHEYQKEKVAC